MSSNLWIEPSPDVLKLLGDRVNAKCCKAVKPSVLISNGSITLEMKSWVKVDTIALRCAACGSIRLLDASVMKPAPSKPATTETRADGAPVLPNVRLDRRDGPPSFSNVRFDRKIKE